MTVLLQDFLSGNLGSTLAAGASGAVTDSSFAALPVVTSPDTLKLVLDPDGTAGDPEIITITAHTAASTTATISRASEGTTAREHLSSTKWVNAVTTTDFNRIGFDGTITADLTGNADTATALAATKNFSLTGDVTAAAVAFDGSGNVELTTAMANNSVDLGTHTTGNYVATVAGGTNITVSGSGSETAAVTVNHATMATPSGGIDANGGVAITTVTLTNGHVTDYTTYDFDSRFLGLTAKAADSDKLDNLNSTQFLRSDAVDTTTGRLTIDTSSVSTAGLQSLNIVDDSTNGTAGISIQYPNNTGFVQHGVFRMSNASVHRWVFLQENNSSLADAQLNNLYYAGSLTSTSDETLKNNEGPALGLSFVNRLAPFTGTWIDGNGEKHQFLGAQSVEAALTAEGVDAADYGMIGNDSEIGPRTMSYMELVPVLVQAVNELTARLEALEG